MLIVYLMRPAALQVMAGFCSYDTTFACVLLSLRILFKQAIMDALQYAGDWCLVGICYSAAHNGLEYLGDKSGLLVVKAFHYSKCQA